MDKLNYDLDDPDDMTHSNKDFCCDTSDKKWGFVCTRPALHKGNHAAGDGYIVVETWVDEHDPV